MVSATPKLDETGETMRLRAAAFRAFADHALAWSLASTSDPIVAAAIEDWRADAHKRAERWVREANATADVRRMVARLASGTGFHDVVEQDGIGRSLCGIAQRRTAWMAAAGPVTCQTCIGRRAAMTRKDSAAQAAEQKKETKTMEKMQTTEAHHESDRKSDLARSVRLGLTPSEVCDVFKDVYEYESSIAFEDALQAAVADKVGPRVVDVEAVTKALYGRLEQAALNLWKGASVSLSARDAGLVEALARLGGARTIRVHQLRDGLDTILSVRLVVHDVEFSAQISREPTDEEKLAFQATNERLPAMIFATIAEGARV